VRPPPPPWVAASAASAAACRGGPHRPAPCAARRPCGCQSRRRVPPHLHALPPPRLPVAVDAPPYGCPSRPQLPARPAAATCSYARWLLQCAAAWAARPSYLGLRGALPASPRRAHAAARATASPEKKPLGHCSTFPVQHSNILFSQFQYFVYTISTFNRQMLNLFNKNVELIVPKY